MSKPIICTPSGLKFAASPSLMVETLSKHGVTVSGYYKVMKNGIRFHKPNGEAWFFFVGNKHHEFFAITCATQTDGRIIHMYSLDDRTFRDIGWHQIGCQARCDWIKDTIAQVRTAKKHS